MTSDPVEQLPAGHVLGGRYRILGLLGEGGMGAVYLGEHLELGRRVAIKVVHPDRAVSGENVERLKLEARAASSIGHRAIVDILDVNVSDGAPYIVMELLEGESLAELIDRRKILDPALIVTIAIEVLIGLDAVHQKEIVHRDLKPENIFIHRTVEGFEQVKILDFGISKSLVEEGGLHLTKTGTIMGTPYFMAPEQAKGAKDIDHRVDLWSLGVVLYVATTGRRPYEATSYNELIAKLLTEPYPPPRDSNPALPESLEGVILRAMSHDLGRRYQTAREFLIDLRQVKAQLQPIDRLLSESAARVVVTPQEVSDIASFTTMSAQVLPASKGKLRWSALLAGGLVMTGIVAMGVFFGLSAIFSEPTTVAPELETTPLVEAPAQAQVAAPASEEEVQSAHVEPPEPVPPEHSAGKVVLFFHGVPEGATVRVDGKAIDGDSVTVPRSEESIPLQLELNDWVKRIEVIPTQNRLINVDELVRTKTRATLGRSRPTKVHRTTRQVQPQSAPSVEASPSSEPEKGREAQRHLGNPNKAGIIERYPQ